MRQPTIVGSIEIAARPATIYGLITDLSRWDRFVVETRVPARAVPAGLAPGTTFRAWNRNGLWRWRTTTTVLQVVPSRSLAFEVTSFGRPVATWRYDIVPTARGSRVTESTRDMRGRTMCLVSVAATGVVDRTARNQRNIERTLGRLKAEAEKSA
ncbi:SRPBCC family protein [Streptomyces sp. NPDC088350]|uniref:SRPBCC family protein n=1 Tax=Streptomyces sp. NPDC088350 TaxID=3365854 RepID=UPI003828B20B